MFVARFVAVAFGVVAGADFCCTTKLRNKSLVCHQPYNTNISEARVLTVQSCHAAVLH